MQEKKCHRCGEVRPLTDYWKTKKEKDGRRSTCKFCTRKDTAKYRVYFDIKCDDCGVDLRRRKDGLKEVNRCKKCANKFNGDKRRGKEIPALRKGDYIPCKQCGEMHYKRLSQLKKDYKNRFCSFECHGKYQAEHFDNPKFIGSADNRGEKNGRYKHGNRIGGHTRHKELRKAVKDRDGEGCYICRTTERLHLHRIIPGALDGRYELENCVFLCRKHHSEVHKDYHKWKPILLQTAKKVNQ